MFNNIDARMDDQCVDSGDGKDDEEEEGFDERLI
jgi:hypothetical protein